jgi:hypothetical protein
MKLIKTVPLSGATLIVAVAMGLVAIAALLGAFSHLHPAASFFVSALAIIFFPGLVISAAFRPRIDDEASFPESLALIFVSGLAPVILLSFFGIVLSLSLNSVILLHVIVYSSLLILLIVRRISARDETEAGGLCGSKAAIIVLVAAAILLGLTTLWSPRDMDDWFYLAYIADYVEGQPIHVTDALMGPDWPSPPRVWFGSWWVTEALLSSVSGAHPVGAHQIYLPILIFPFAIFAVFMLARRIFKSGKAAYLACSMQVLLYLSSAYPSDTAGWALFARTAQDKSFAFLVPAVVATSLGLGIIRRSLTHPEPVDRRLYVLYFISVLTSGLIHPMGLVWCAVALIPFALVELVRDRRKRPALALALIVIPLVIGGLILTPGSEATSLLKDVDPGPYEGRGVTTLIAPYLPGDQARAAAGDRILSLNENTFIAHPLLITRYPLAIAGLVLTFAILAWWRRSRAARFLVVLAASVLFLAYVPGVAGITSGLITRKMLYRLTWLLPWGFTIVFFLTRAGLRLRWCWVLAVVIALALSRGNPANYFSLMAAAREGGRPSAEFVEAAHALGAEPAPRGVVLAATNTGIMIPAYVEEAYPAYVSPAYSTVFRSEKIRTPKDLREFLAGDITAPSSSSVMEDFSCSYIFLRTTTSQAQRLEILEPEYRPVFANREFGVWEMPRQASPGN